jgi:hypothetical protein
VEQEAFKVLKKFHRSGEPKNYPPETQQELCRELAWQLVNRTNQQIHTIYLDIPLHQSTDIIELNDSRPLPNFKEGDIIPNGIFQWYLSKRIQEWIAFSGQIWHEKGETYARSFGNEAFKRDFHWDLWDNLQNLRAEAWQVRFIAERVTYLAKTKVLPAIQEERESFKGRTESFDTQI